MSMDSQLMDMDIVCQYVLFGDAYLRDFWYWMSLYILCADKHNGLGLFGDCGNGLGGPTQL
jgi:hypothetical protein